MTGMTGSLWSATAGEAPPRAPLPGETSVDVAIVGAGYTGLWTAYYLRRAAPDLRIAVLERAHAGFGASGRNGGWCSAIFPVGMRKLAQMHGLERATALRIAMQDTVAEVGRVAAAEEMEADYEQGGVVILIRNPAQMARAQAELESARRHGIRSQAPDAVPGGGAGPGARRERAGRAVLPTLRGPASTQLVRRLADRVEQLGVSVYEQTAARAIEPRAVGTDRGRVTADVVVRATEAYTAQLPGDHRAVLPIYSLMVATEPLPQSARREIGLP